MRRLFRLAAVLLTAACQKGPGRTVPPAMQTETFRAMAGISMGAIGTSFIGARHPDRFDALGMLGGPFDAAYMLGAFEREQVSGFCPLDRLEAAAALDAADGGHRLDTPGALDCGTIPAQPPVPYEHPQDFNHWWFTANGGSFNRNSYINIFEDLTLALGNPMYDNPDSPFYPAPGVTWSAIARPDICTHPVVVKNFFNAEYNPPLVPGHPESGARYHAITFCDGQAPIEYCTDPANTYVDWCKVDASSDPARAAAAFCKSLGGAVQVAGKDHRPDIWLAHEGRYDPCYPHDRPVTFGLAIDINGNGRRDYYEPIALNGHERFQDTGSDGCSDPYEDGKGGCVSDPAASPYARGVADPNGDDYDPVNNPSGTERDWKWEPGEPFRDDGLDGVPGTNDYGEGNGKFDQAPNRLNLLSQDLRTQFAQWSPAQQRHVAIYLDGGIRDVFNFGISALNVWGGIHRFQPGISAFYQRFVGLPAIGDWGGGFDYTEVDWPRVPQDIFIRYGNPDASSEQIAAGDGDHVGSFNEVLWRINTFYTWLNLRWEPILGMHKVTGVGCEMELSIPSPALNAPRNFVVTLPPGYFDPANAQVRYPVLYMLHGYGQQPGDMAGLSVLTNSMMNQGTLVPMIIVYPSGRCCLTNPQTGERTCNEHPRTNTTFDASQCGNSYSGPGYADLGWVRECNEGDFYVDRQGTSLGDQTKYEGGILDLMSWVDRNLRALPAAQVPVPPSR